jgi:Flp pilus assembly protein TadD
MVRGNDFIGPTCRFRISVLFNLLILIAAVFVHPMPVAAQGRNYSVSGWVTEGGGSNRITGVRVELHAMAGGIVGTAFTASNGNFEFDNIPPGNYNLVADSIGHEPVTQQVNVQDGAVFGVEVEIHASAEAAKDPHAASKVSVRELAIPQKAQAAMAKGMGLLYKKSDYQGSITQFQKAISEYPDYYEAYAHLGVAYQRFGDSSASEVALRKSVELSQDQYLDGLCFLAAFLSDRGRFTESEAIARKSIELDPNSWQANSALASALLGQNRNKEAEVNAAAAVKLQPDFPELHLILANIHARLRNLPAVLDDLNAYLQLDPKGPFADHARSQKDEIQRALASAQMSSPTLGASGR